jgi:hypothetical protein
VCMCTKAGIHACMLPLVCTHAMQELERELKAALLHACPEAIGKNGADLLKSRPEDWAFELNVMQLMAPGARTDPVHYDGGASLLFMAVTLWGSRETHVHLASTQGAAPTKRAKRPRAAVAADATPSAEAEGLAMDQSLPAGAEGAQSSELEAPRQEQASQ